MSDHKKKRSFWKKPKSKWLLGIPVGAFVCAIIGVIALSGIQYGLHATSSTEFCSACHIGMDTIVEEYQESIHFRNATGVSAGCSDCHVRQETIPYLMEKVGAVSHIWHKAFRGITLENFDGKHRERLANKVWDKMRSEGSSTCQTCHSFDRMDLKQQTRSAKLQHPAVKRKDKTCIDCHKGVAHKLPEEDLDDLFDE